MKRQKNIQQKAQSFAADAVDRAIELAEDVSDRIRPYAEELSDKVRPLVDDHVMPLMEQAQSKISPVAKDVTVNTASTVNTLLENTGLTDYSTALAKLQDTNTKLTKDAKKQLKSLVKSNKAELKALARQEKKSCPGKKIGLIAGIAAVLVGLGFGIRKYLGSADANGWTAHQPQASSTVDDKPVPTPEQAAADDGASLSDDTAGEVTTSPDVEHDAEPRRGMAEEQPEA